ncbi:MAG TPA: DUF3455 domain-containing protein [Burkholderiaceae bacterium]|nr:DUF3455 domain-containing protein [Burkholderiaceae bacterium]
MDRLTPVCLAAAMAVLAACTAPLGPSAVPDTLKPEGQRMSDRVAARGVQIYECRALPNATGASWAFVAPDAELLDARGAVAGKHYAGPHWEAADGSKIVGAVKARADAPQASAIPWLLLSAKSVGGPGRFAKVTSVQRIHTVGGLAPAKPCDPSTLGAIERVPYTADYLLFSS